MNELEASVEVTYRELATERRTKTARPERDHNARRQLSL
jgi:hypothetical protein